MIRVKIQKGKNENGEFCEPSRDLTPKEKQSVIAQWADDSYFIYFQEKDIDTDLWNQYQEHIELQNPDEKLSHPVIATIQSMTLEEKQELVNLLKEQIILAVDK